MKTTKRRQTTKKRNPQDLTLRNLRAIKRRLFNVEAAVVLIDQRQEEIEKVIADLALRVAGLQIPEPIELSMREAAKRMMEHGE